MAAAEKPFLMPVEDVFRLRQGRVLMATGRIERGWVRRGDEVEIAGFGGGTNAVVADIDAGGRRTDEAGVGMNVGLVLRRAAAGALERGQVLAAPGSVNVHVGFAAEITLLSEEEDGAEVFSGERLCFYVRAAAVWGVVTAPLPLGADVMRPLGTAAVTVTLEQPVALEEDQPFAFRHHGRAAGSGTVTQLLR